MNALDKVLSSKWKVSCQNGGGLVIETIDHLYIGNRLKKDGTPKKGVKPKRVIVALVFSKTAGQYICDVHNLFLAQDKSVFLKEEIGKAIKQLLQR